MCKSCTVKQLWQDPTSHFHSEETQGKKFIRHSEQSRAKISASLRKHHNTDAYKQWCKEFWTVEKRAEFTKQLIECRRENPWSTQLGGCVSKLELSLTGSLQVFGFLHSSQHQTRIGVYVPDFINEETKTVLEVFGDFWHSNPNHPTFGDPSWRNPFTKLTSIERWEIDEKRKDYIESQGYTVIVIWESDIRR